MRRIIGTIGATLAVVAPMLALSANIVSAQDPTASVNRTDEFSNQGGGNDTVDVTGLDNIKLTGRTTSVTLDAPFIGYKDTGSAATSPLIALVDTS
jgi:hypothetical protein